MKVFKSLNNLENKLTTGIAIFDFDGTLTKRDTLLAFIEFTHNKRRLYWELLLLSPQLILMKFGFGNNEIVKTKLLDRLFKGTKKETLKAWAQVFCDKYFNALLRPAGLAKVLDLQRQGYRIILVTASVEIWVKPFADRMNVELIGTKFLFNQQIFTGRLATPNCRGLEKVNRLKTYLKTEKLPPFLMHGDSDGDRSLYEEASTYFHRPFD